MYPLPRTLVFYARIVLSYTLSKFELAEERVGVQRDLNIKLDTLTVLPGQIGILGKGIL